MTDIRPLPNWLKYPKGNSDPNIKYVNVQWAKEYEYKEGDIISMHGFTGTDEGEYKVVSSKQWNDRTVELKVQKQ